MKFDRERHKNAQRREGLFAHLAHTHSCEPQTRSINLAPFAACTELTVHYYGADADDATGFRLCIPRFALPDLGFLPIHP